VTIDIEAAGTIRFDISIWKRYVDIFDISKHHYYAAMHAALRYCSMFIRGRIQNFSYCRAFWELAAIVHPPLTVDCLARVFQAPRNFITDFRRLPVNINVF